MEENIDLQYVLDTSFVIAHFLPDEKSKRVDDYFFKYQQGEIHFCSTQLLRFEVLNALKTAVLRRRINKQNAKEIAEEFFNLKIDIFEVDFLSILDLAFENLISVYDASYLFLSRVRGISLLTLDKGLQKMIT